jgi:hypothetical protein
MMVETIIEIIQWPVLSIRVYRFNISRNFTAGARCWLIHQHVTKRAAWIVMIRLSTKPSHDFEQDGGSYCAKASLGDAVHKWRMGTWRTWWQTIWSKGHTLYTIFGQSHLTNIIWETLDMLTLALLGLIIATTGYPWLPGFQAMMEWASIF